MARGRTSALVIQLSPEEHQTLVCWQRSTTMAAGLVRRRRIILLVAQRQSQSAVAQLVGVQRAVVRKWAKRFLAERLERLAGAPGCGAKGDFPS
jgi:Homeodomain-like domain